MSNFLPSINLDLPKKLKDKNYRRSFFLAETSALIAKQLISLRKRRGLNQTQVAELLETKQPAISRVERADYHNWSFNTLWKLAEAMDARLRVLIEPVEDVLAEYEPQQAIRLEKLFDEITWLRPAPNMMVTIEKSATGGRIETKSAATAKTEGEQQPRSQLIGGFDPFGHKTEPKQTIGNPRETLGSGASWN